MRALKLVFNTAAVAGGGAGTVFGLLGLISSGWSSNQVDLTLPAVALTALCATVFYAGIRGLRKDAVDNAKSSDDDQPKPPAP